MGFYWLNIQTAVGAWAADTAQYCADQGPNHLINGRRTEASGRGAAAGEQLNIRGNEINDTGRGAANQYRQGLYDCNIGGWRMDLSAQEQRGRALMAGFAGIMMHPLVDSGHRRHGLDQKEKRQAKDAGAAFNGTHDPSGRHRHYEIKYKTPARAAVNSFCMFLSNITNSNIQLPPEFATAVEADHSPMILTSTRLRRRPSNSP
jgi:hypothetical protein